MRAIDALTKEHRVFLRLIDRIERALRRQETQARAEVRESLLVLLPALDRHEEIEDSVFAGEDSAPEGDGKALLAELRREHARVNLLRAEIAEALGGAENSWGGFGASVAELTAKLRDHFIVEEKRLWPRYARTAGRSRDKSAARRVLREVRRLEGEIDKNRLIVSDYLSEAR